MPNNAWPLWPSTATSAPILFHRRRYARRCARLLRAKGLQPVAGDSLVILDGAASRRLFTQLRAQPLCSENPACTYEQDGTMCPCCRFDLLADERRLAVDLVERALLAEAEPSRLTSHRERAEGLLEQLDALRS